MLQAHYVLQFSDLLQVGRFYAGWTTLTSALGKNCDQNIYEARLFHNESDE